MLEACLENSIQIYHTCGGNASCSTCRIRVLRGSENLSSMDAQEAQLLDSFDLKPPYRLSCQSMIKGDIEIEIPEHDKEPRPNKTPKIGEGPRGTY